MKCKWCGEAIYEGIPEGKKKVFAHEDGGFRKCANSFHVAFPANNDPAKQVFNVYRNTRFTKRDYESTNIAACLPVEEAARIPEGYEVAPAAILSTMQPLWIESGIQYWGWL